MKKVTFLILALVAFQSKAIDLGSLDTSFSNDGVSDGWDRSGEPGFHRYGSAVLVDSQGRVYVAGTFDYEVNGYTEKAVHLDRYLANGQPDASFGTSGTKNFYIPPAATNQFEYSLVLGPSDSIFLGYSRLYCVTGNECHSDIRVYYLDSTGNEIDSITIPFDLGGTWDRNDDNISDMVYIPTLNRLAIAAEVERGGANDTDFGVAVVVVDGTTGALSLDTAFSADGKEVCYFDQGATNDTDRARAIVYNWLQGSVVVGGTVFEGNGIGGDGTNLAFCEFSLSDGNLLRKWSTQTDPDVADEREYLSDMVYVVDAVDNGGIITLTSGIIVAATLPGAGDVQMTDFGLTKFTLGATNWERNPDFGPDSTGIVTTNFNWFFTDTDDYVSEMILESEGSTILLAGTANWDNQGFPNSVSVLARYTYSGILDTNWGIGKSGKAVSPLSPYLSGKYWESAESIAVDPNTEEIYIAGWSYDGLNFKSIIANFINDQIFGDNFDF
jgi:hypothetical protein